MRKIVDPTPGHLAVHALRIAEGYAGAKVHEEGGNNQGDQVEFFQHLMDGAPGDPWCADFVCCCLVKSYAQLTGQAESRADLPHYLPVVRSAYLGMSGSCPALWSDAVVRRMARRRSFRAFPGDLVLFDFLGQGAPHHVGFVHRLLPAGLIETIEGNTSSGAGGSQGDGDGVYLRKRGGDHVFGFIHFGPGERPA